jgi:hypothetical protein
MHRNKQNPYSIASSGRGSRSSALVPERQHFSSTGCAKPIVSATLTYFTIFLLCFETWIAKSTTWKKLSLLS